MHYVVAYLVFTTILWTVDFSYQDDVTEKGKKVDLIWMVHEQTEIPEVRLHSIYSVIHTLKSKTDLHCGFLYYGFLPFQIVPLSSSPTLTNKKELNLTATARTRPLISLINAQRLLRVSGRARASTYLVIVTDNLNNFDDECIRYLLGLVEQGVCIIIKATGKYFHYENEFEKQNVDITVYDSETSLTNALHTVSSRIINETLSNKPVALLDKIVIQNVQKNGSEVCQNAVFSGGIGYHPHPFDCGAIYECTPDNRGQYVAHLRLCEFGLAWDESFLACRAENLVQCKHDNCRFAYLISTSKLGTCGAYYKCVDGHSISTCCDTGHAYNASSGCMREKSCTGGCVQQKQEHVEGTCKKRQVLGRPRLFQEYFTITGEWVEQRCPFESVFSEDQCGCVDDLKKTSNVYSDCQPALYLPFCEGLNDMSTYRATIVNEGNRVEVKSGKAYFNGFSKLVVPSFAGKDLGDTVVIRFKYKIAKRTDLSEDANDQSSELYEIEENPFVPEQDSAMPLFTNAKCEGDVFDPGPCEGRQSISYFTSYTSTAFEAETYDEGITIITRRKEEMNFDQNNDEFDDREVYYQEFINGDSKTNCTHDTWDNTWHNVSIFIRGGTVTVSEDNRTHSATLSGKLRVSDDGLQFGQGNGLLGFQGYMDEILIYLCDPDSENKEKESVDNTNNIYSSKEINQVNLQEAMADEAKDKNIFLQRGRGRKGGSYSVETKRINFRSNLLFGMARSNASYENTEEIHNVTDVVAQSNEPNRTWKLEDTQYFLYKNFSSSVSSVKDYIFHSIKKDTDAFYDKSEIRNQSNRTSEMSEPGN